MRNALSAARNRRRGVRASGARACCRRGSDRADPSCGWGVALERYLATRQPAVLAGRCQRICASSPTGCGYSLDYDERLPPGEPLDNLRGSHIQGSFLFGCPASRDLRWGYAMNRFLSSVPMRVIAEPAQTPAVRFGVGDPGCTPLPSRLRGGSTSRGRQRGLYRWARGCRAFETVASHVFVRKGDDGNAAAQVRRQAEWITVAGSISVQV